MALALYRRYRPDTFEGVIGQDQVVIPLSRALDKNKLTHAYLFSGPRGCGKTSSARILARCINCVKGPTSHPCGECESCKDLSATGAGSIDVVEIDAASHNGVDDARELRERAGFAPARDKYKIFILDEAHMVTQQGFNALLKIVEEPPEHVMFIFATTEPEKVIGTIRSRTHHYPFRLVPSEIMGPYLEKVCDKEEITPEPGVLKLAMRAGGGSVRDTLSVLDQLMVGSVNGEISYESASALLGFTPEELISKSIDAIIERDGSALYSAIEKVVVGGFEPRRFVEDLLARVRDLLVLTLAGSQAVQIFNEDTEGEDADSLKRQAQALGLSKLTLIAQKINDTLANMAGATSPRMRLELLAAQLLSAMESQSAYAQGVHTQENPIAAAPSLPIQTTQSSASQPAMPQASTAQPSAEQHPQVQATSQPVSAAQAPIKESAVQKTRSTNSGSQSENSSKGSDDEYNSATAAAPTEVLPVQASDHDLWKQVLAAMPKELSVYVDAQKVPFVEFSTNTVGGKHLVLTFDAALSQHAFAMAVTGENRSVPGLVQKEVRKLFGATASIAPNTVAANGEAVQTVRSMSPEQRAAVKRDIALAAMKSATTTSSTASPSREQHDSAAPKASEKGNDSESDDHHVVELDNEDPWAAEQTQSEEVAHPDGGLHSDESSQDSQATQPSEASHPVESEMPGSQESTGKEVEEQQASDIDDDGFAVARTPAPQKTVSPDSEQDTVALSSNGDMPTNAATQTQDVSQQTPSDVPSVTELAPEPKVNAEDDVYSLSDDTVGVSDAVDLDTLKKIFDVKEVKELPGQTSD